MVETGSRAERIPQPRGKERGVGESRKRHQTTPEVPEDLSLEDKKRLVAWVKSRQAEYGDFDWIDHPKMLRRHVDECLAYHAAKNNPGKYVNWLAACRKWLVKEQGIRERDRQAGRRESFVNLDGPTRLRVVK